jgi:hypothetical protein
MGPRGILDNLKISNLSYADKPMDLSNYLLIRTKEKMILEAKLQNKDLVMTCKPLESDLDLAK